MGLSFNGRMARRQRADPGSIPGLSTLGSVVQLGEQRVRTAKVAGSSPAASTDLARSPRRGAWLGTRKWEVRLL